MNKYLALTIAGAFLAACSGPSDDDGGSGTGSGGGSTGGTDGGAAPLASSVVVGDVQGASYDGASETLIVQITMDGNNVTQNYGTGVADGDYTYYEQQLTTTDRFFSAFAATSTDGSVSGVVVSDGGQFNRFFGGATANQASYTAPAGGIVNFSGEYVGLLNFGTAAGDAPGESSTPTQSFQVNGDAYIKADFSDNYVNGNIFNRTYGADGTGTALPEIVLVDATINADGSFSGLAELGVLEEVGSFEGVFGGSGASAVAGTVALEAGFSDGIIPGATGNEREFGIFVLDSE